MSCHRPASESDEDEGEGETPTPRPEDPPPALESTSGLTLVAAEQGSPECGSQSEDEAANGENSTPTAEEEEAGLGGSGGGDNHYSSPPSRRSRGSLPGQPGLGDSVRRLEVRGVKENLISVGPTGRLRLLHLGSMM